LRRAGRPNPKSIMKIHNSISIGNRSYVKGDDIPWYYIYFVLYTFLLRQLVLDLARARENEQRRKFVDSAYVVISVALYALAFFIQRR
jgi:hypothetical protein